MSTFLTAFYRLCSIKNISPSSAMDDMGIGRSALKRWREGGIPQPHTIRRVADYFGVPASAFSDPDFSPEKEEFTDQEKSILAMFRGTTEEGRLRMIQAMMNIRDEEEKKKKAASKGAAG